MKKVLLSLMLIGFLLSSCSSTVSDSTPPLQASADQPTHALSQTSSNETGVPTLTSQPMSPTATSTTPPQPTNFNKDNYQSFTSVTSYSTRIESALGIPATEISYRDFSYSQNGKKIAVWGCAHNCQTMDEKYFLAILGADVETPVQLVQINDQLKPISLALSSTGEDLYYSLPYDVYRFNTVKNTSELIWKADKGNGFSFLGISPDDQTLAISNINYLTILSLSDLVKQKVISGRFYGNVQRPQFSNTGEYLAIPTATYIEEITLFDSKDWNPVKVIKTPGISKSTLSPDGSLLALAYDDTGEIELLDVLSGAVVKTSTVAVTAVHGMAFDPSGKLLVLAVSPGPDADMLENLLVIDVATGVELPSLISYDEPAVLIFSADGNSIFMHNYSSALFEKWSLPNQEISKVEAFAREYFDAISSQDYAKAAAMTTLDQYDVAELTKRGLSTDNLAAAFESMCGIDDVPCLPLSRIIRVGSQKEFGWDYDVYFTLLQPDGTELNIDGVTRYSTIGVKMEADGSMRIIGLHPGMYMPYID